MTLSATAFLFNYAAPELFVMQFDDDEQLEDHERGGSKTVQTDVYAFGCLYYAVRSKRSLTYSVEFSNDLSTQIFFDTIPFVERNEYQIMRLVTAGVRPPRLDSPRMEDGTWDLILECWRAKSFERPGMEQIKMWIPN